MSNSYKYIITAMKNHYSSLRYLLFSFVILGSCTSAPETAQEIVSRSVEAYGGSKMYKSDIAFDFRDIHYRSYSNEGMMSYERTFEHDSLGSVHDVLNNDGFTRKVNDEVVTLDEEWTARYTRSVNSVIYFFRIPFNLDDPSVSKSRLDDTQINGRDYYKIYITFSEEGGGEDFDDSFIYWIDKETFYIDYMAYSYSTDGGGMRFREAINPRIVNDLRVVDYINYAPIDEKIPLEDLEALFIEGNLEELSRIENENIEVNYLQ